MTPPAETCTRRYLAYFGLCEILHFRDEAAMSAYMRSELRRAGRFARHRNIDKLQDAFISLVHDRHEGPVQWGAVEFATG